MRSSCPHSAATAWGEEGGLLSGWTGGSGTRASPVLLWAPGGLSGMVPWGWAPLWPPQPTWAHVRKAGMSRTGTFLVSAFTRRFRSSVNSTTSRSSRIGSSVGTRERRDFTEGRRQRHWLPLLFRGGKQSWGLQASRILALPQVLSLVRTIRRGRPSPTGLGRATMGQGWPSALDPHLQRRAVLPRALRAARPPQTPLLRTLS